MRQSAAVLLAVAVLAADADADTLEGRASVLGGDTIEVRGQQTRLLGIDAPEPAQTCWDAAGEIWPCGQKAALALAAKFGGASVTCKGMVRDREGRLIAICWAGEVNLNAWLVAGGHLHTVVSPWPTYRLKRPRKAASDLGRGVRAAATKH